MPTKFQSENFKEVEELEDLSIVGG